MGLFDAFNKKKVQPLPITGKTYKFINSGGFRGFKRYFLVTRNYPTIQDGIDALKKPNPKYTNGGEESRYIFDLTQAVIEIAEGTHSGNQTYLLVIADGHHVGNFYINSDEDRQLLEDFRKGRIEKVHVRIEWKEEKTSSLEKNGKIKTVTEERGRSYLFIKRKEK